MDNQTDITPALSAEEWAARQRVTGDDGDHTVGQIGGTVFIQDRWDGAGTSELAAIIAFANHALPNTDPRKITRADAEYIRLCAETFGIPGTPVHDDLCRIAAKLAALLPPA